MPCLAYPVAAPPGELKVWVGVTAQTTAPNLTWQLNGAAAQPTAIRAITSVRTSALGVPAGSNEPRAFTGLYRFTGLGATRGPYTVQVTAGGVGSKTLKKLYTLPSAIPDDGLNVFLTSCFHVAEAKLGHLHTAVKSLKDRCGVRKQPDFSILMGDQVYLDLPTFGNLPSGRKRLAKIFEQRYLRNWGGSEDGVGEARSFNDILSAAPFFALSDDHEFWNNYPHRSPIIQNSWSTSGQANWRAVSQTMFRAFQAYNPGSPEQPIRMDLDEVSFFLVDTRYARTNNTFMPPTSLGALRQWVDDLNATRRVGVIVTGQSLYAKAAGAVSGAIADYEYPDYDDFAPVVRELARTRPPLICVTGDVHWGRVIKSTSRDPNRNGNVYEVITSPSALVTTVGSDQLAETTNFFSGLFGRGDKWPRHSEPTTDPKEIGGFANEIVNGSRIVSPAPYQKHTVVKGLKGDQIALLSFRRSAGRKISAIVTYWTVDGRTTSPVFAPVHLFDYSRP